MGCDAGSAGRCPTAEARIIVSLIGGEGEDVLSDALVDGE